MNLIIQNGQEIRYSKDRIVVNGVTIPNPPKFKANSVMIVDNRLFVGGYEYINGKWKRKVTDLDFHGYVGDKSIIIECEYEKLKCNKNGCPIVVDNELVKEKHIVRI